MFLSVMYQIMLLVFERLQAITCDVCAIKQNCLHDEHSSQERRKLS